MNRIVLDSAPAPISRAYRLMYDQPDPELAYPAIALFSEPLIKWYGVVALVLLRQCRPDVLRGEGLLSQFLSPSLGVWTQLIRLATAECGSAAPAALRPFLDETLARQSGPLTQCVRQIEDYLGSGLQKRTIIDFFDALVFYRNKTRGHGAPSPQHQRDLSHVLLDGYDDALRRLDGLLRLRLVYVERAEIQRGGAVHVLRICNGLNSFILPERLALGAREGLASGSVHLFSEESKPLVELSPILVRPPGSDSFYFYNGSRKNVEYLSYDGTGQEYYRPDGYLEAVREFLSLTESEAAAPRGTSQPPRFRDRDEDRDAFSFGDLGM
jgi:hypothetical protein